MIHNIAITKARINLGAIVRKVSIHNDTYILNKDEIPVAVLISIEDFKKCQKILKTKKS